MKRPPLLNTVLPTKIYTILDWSGSALTEWIGDSAQQALCEAKETLGPIACSAVIKIHKPE